MKKIFMMLPVWLMVLAACNKKEVAELDFNVSVEKTTYKAGDTVNFKITGNPEQLTFYSGEKGSQYSNRERTTADGVPQLNFSSYMQYGTQTNTLKLLVSSDFNGTYNAASIAAASWTDITSKAILSTGADNTASGTIDLSSFKSDKPIFLAFSFTGSTVSTQRTWTVKNVAVSNLLADGSRVTVAGMADAGWIAINLNNSPRSWTVSATQLQFQGGAQGIGDNSGWLITKPLFLTKVSPDRGVALKNMSTRMTNYRYIYKTDGVFEPTFVAANTNVYGASNSVQQLSITVKP